MTSEGHEVEFVGGPFEGPQRLALPAARMPRQMLMPVNSQNEPHCLETAPSGWAVYERRECDETLKYFFTGDFEPASTPEYMVELVRPKRVARDTQNEVSSEAQDKKWLRLEKLASRIYSELEPNAIVKHDDKIPGQDSDIKRQIDVSIRANVAGHDLLIVVDAKDYSKPADINDVGKFSTLVGDVRASKGVMICNRGFTKGAEGLAKTRGIDLCSVFDVEERDWGADLRIPVLMDNTGVSIRQRGFIALPDGCSVPDNTADWKFELNGRLVEPTSDFVHEWNAKRILEEPGQWRIFKSWKEGLKTLVWQGGAGASRECWVNIRDYSFEYRVERKWLFKFCKPEEYRGLKNTLTGELRLSAMRVIVPQDPNLKEWQHVPDEKSLHERAGQSVLVVQRLLTQNEKGEGGEVFLGPPAIKPGEL